MHQYRINNNKKPGWNPIKKKKKSEVEANSYFDIKAFHTLK